MDSSELGNSMAPKQSENEMPGKFLIKLPETVAGIDICIRDLVKPIYRASLMVPRVIQ